MLSLRNLVAAFAVVVFLTLPADGADKEQEAKDKAKAALALAKAAREREKAAVSIPKAKSWSDALDAAKKAKKPLVIWVGIDVKDQPEIFEKLKGPAVNMRMDEYYGSKVPRLYYTSNPEVVYYIEAKALTVNAIDVIAKSWPKKDVIESNGFQIGDTKTIVQEK
jgi:hypothetical protein